MGGLPNPLVTCCHDSLAGLRRAAVSTIVPFRGLTTTPNTIADFPEICIPGFSCRKSNSRNLVGKVGSGCADFSSPSRALLRLRSGKPPRLGLPDQTAPGGLGGNSSNSARNRSTKAPRAEMRRWLFALQGATAIRGQILRIFLRLGSSRLALGVR
jgi:hypothetical protein